MQRIQRRQLLKLGAGAALITAASGLRRPAQSQDFSGTIRIGFWPIAAGLPLYLGVGKGIFEDFGLTVEAVRLGTAQQVAEGIISGRLEGSANGTASGALAVAEIASPGLFKIIATNPSNADHVLDQFLVPIDSPIQAISELSGKRVASAPGAQNVTVAQGILAANGVTDVEIQPLDISQHVPALQAGQLDAVYTLEPTGTIGSSLGITRVLEAGVVAKYLLGDPQANWSGGAATLTTEFIEQYPETTQTYIDAYRAAIEDIRQDPVGARAFLSGYTAIEGDLAQAVPLAAYLMYDEFTPADVASFQKFYDFLTDAEIFSRSLDVSTLLYS
ncbi:MAG: ABC transporter substrate-binding protein [Synechococcaceae cyanobacterium SM2_3_2]|nr:ABC transporter substrate-binding protein [Synechococcaceae cyanobacterium SM2_3_2]